MRASICILTFAVAGCPAPTTPTAQAPTPAASTTFEHLDLDHRIEFMKTVVLPKMKPIFQTHDAKKFSSFGCQTCHGAGANSGDYEMPNTDLPKLDFSDLGHFQQVDLDWMQNEVKPTMASLLGQPESTRTRKGFGCLSCHTKP
jgi:hypothetical protein